MGIGGISDHRPIYLELDDSIHKIKYSFKFNSSWLQDPAYIKMVTEYWQAHLIRENEDITKGFVQKLKYLKGISEEWAHKKRKREDVILREAEQAIKNLEGNTDGTFTS